MRKVVGWGMIALAVINVWNSLGECLVHWYGMGPEGREVYILSFAFCAILIAWGIYLLQDVTKVQQIANYAPPGMEDPTNQVWVHVGGKAYPMKNIHDAITACRGCWPQADTRIRNRRGVLLYQRNRMGVESPEVVVAN